MVAVPFGYLAAGSYDEAVALLAEHGEDARVLAGGQSLMPMLNLRLARPGVLIDINDADRREPTADGGLLRLPALSRHRALTENGLVRAHCPLLAEAAGHVGNTQVRNRGTVGGSLAHADPAAEIGACALAADARVVVRGPDGERTLPVRDLFVTYLTTALAPAEVITDVLIPVAGPRDGWGFCEMTRRASDFAVVAVAAWVRLGDDRAVVAEARVALAGVADRVVLAAPEVAAGLRGASTADPGPVIEAFAAALAGCVEPRSDVQASAGYRRRLTGVLSARALRQAIGRAAVGRAAGAAA